MVTMIAQPATTSNKKQLPEKIRLAEEAHQEYRKSCSTYEQATNRKLRPQADTLVIAGFGCSLHVQHNALVVNPGTTHKEQTSKMVTLYRGVHGVKHIIILSLKGTLSLDAIQWCKEQEIAVTMIDEHGNLVTSITPEQVSNVSLRRCQYTTPNNGVIAAGIIQKKLQGQLATLQAHNELPQADRASEILITALTWFDLPTLPPALTNIDHLRLYEARCANAYFEAWQGLPITWDKAGDKSVPPHWKEYDDRSSPLSKGHGARHSVNPLNTILNYAYACLESMVRQALTSQGFDTSVGIMHADSKYRDSPVYDVMDMHRPNVDHLALKLIASKVFCKGDFVQKDTGECHMNPELCRYIAATCRLSQDVIDASVSWLKQEIMR